MTREEEIRQEIDLRLAGCFGNYSEGYEEGFNEGAKWADETMIDKACDWLQNELYEVMTEPNPYYISEVQSKSYNSLEVLINDFKKVMEL